MFGFINGIRCVSMAMLLGMTCVITLTGCANRTTSRSGSPLMSERQYAVQSEAIARDLYKTGQAPTLGDARADAVAIVNQEWAAASRNAARKKSQEKFVKELNKLDAGK